VSEIIDWQKHETPKRGSKRGLIILLVLVAVLVLGSRTALSFWVDLLWFGSLGYSDVFWT